jgi:hypothetical protein
VALNSAWLTADEKLPWGDAPGHLRILVRWHDWVGGQQAPPSDPFGPGLYLVSDFFLRHLGHGLDTALFALAVFAAILAAGLSRVGMRLQGLTACALLPIAVLAMPAIGNYSHLYLLGLPATALLPWVFLACWSSDGFRRWLPTLGLGLTLGLAILAKYQIAYWLLPVLVAPGLLMVLRSPASLVPLAALGPTFFGVLKSLLLQATTEQPPPPGVVQATIHWQLETIVEAASILVAAWILLRWRAPEPWHRRLRPGFALGLAALLTLGLVVPWSMIVAQDLYAHVQYVVGEMDHSTWPEHKNMLQGQVDAFWPKARGWLILGTGLSALELLSRIRPIRKHRVTGWLYGAQGRLPQAAPLVLLGLGSALGVLVTVTQVLNDPRYYLPLFVCLGMLAVLPLCHFTPTRWLLAPVLGAACLVQLFPGWAREHQVFDDRLVSVGVHSAYTTGRYRAMEPSDGLWLLHHAAEPVTDGATGATERALIAAHAIDKIPRTLGGSSRCGSLGYVTGIPIEDRTMYGLASLHGHGECKVDRLVRIEQRTGELIWEPKSPRPRALLLVGTTPQQDAAVLAAMAERTTVEWALVSSEQVLTDRAVSLYRWEQPGTSIDGR